MRHTLTVTFDLFNAGCLVGILEGKIKDVEFIVLAWDEHSIQYDKDAINEFLGQLRGCLRSVTEARARALGTEPFPAA